MNSFYKRCLLIVCTGAAAIMVTSLTIAATMDGNGNKSSGGTKGGIESTSSKGKKEDRKPIVDRDDRKEPSPREPSMRELLQAELDKLTGQAASERNRQTAERAQACLDMGNKCQMDIRIARIQESKDRVRIEIREAYKFNSNDGIEKPKGEITGSRSKIEILNIDNTGLREIKAPDKAKEAAGSHTAVNNGPSISQEVKTRTINEYHPLPDREPNSAPERRETRGTANPTPPVPNQEGLSIEPKQIAQNDPSDTFGTPEFFKKLESIYGYDPTTFEPYGSISPKTKGEANNANVEVASTIVKDKVKAYVKSTTKNPLVRNFLIGDKIREVVTDPEGAAKDVVTDGAAAVIVKFVEWLAPKAKVAAEGSVGILFAVLTPQETSSDDDRIPGPFLGSEEHRRMQLTRKWIEDQIRNQPSERWLELRPENEKLELKPLPNGNSESSNEKLMK